MNVLDLFFQLPSCVEFLNLYFLFFGLFLDEHTFRKLEFKKWLHSAKGRVQKMMKKSGIFDNDFIILFERMW